MSRNPLLQRLMLGYVEALRNVPLLLYLLARGPGVFSLDHLLARHYRVLGR